MIKTILSQSPMHRITSPMQRILRSAMLVACLVCASLIPASLIPSASSDALHTMKPLDRTSPNTVIMQHDGTAISFADLATRPVLVNFWASWCAPCVHELPDLAVLNTALAADDMAVILVGIDRKGHEFGEEFLAQKGINIPTRVYDPSGDLPRALEINVMPTSFLIQPGGRIVGRIEGPLNWPSPKVIAAVRSALLAP